MLKEKKNFYCFLIMIVFMVCYLVSFMLSSQTINIGKLTALAGATIYPVTYFIAILFYERYGRRNALLMLTYTIFALILATSLILFATKLPIYKEFNLFPITFNIMVSSIAGFIFGHLLNLYIYSYLGEKNGFSFLIAGVISITIDSLITIALGNFGILSFEQIVRLFTGQYVVSIVLIIFYSLCFAYLAPSVKKMIQRIEKEKSIEKAKEEEPKKEAVKKEVKKPAKKAAPKKPVKKQTKKSE